MRNLAAKSPEVVWARFKAPATTTDQAPSRPSARELAEGLVKITAVSYPTPSPTAWIALTPVSPIVHDR
jgi:hypothetical protein